MSTGGRVFPSALGGGLARATRAILDAEMASRQRDLQSRQLDIMDRAQALNQFTTLVEFLEPGTTLGSLGEGGKTMFSNAFGVDAQDLNDLVLSPETLQTAIDSVGVDLLNSPEGLSLVRPAVRAKLGLEPSESVSHARDLDAAIQLESARSILQNPEFVREITLRRIGREPIEVRVPGFGGQPDKLVNFDSERAAQIYADFLMQRDGFGFQLSESAREQGSQLIKTIQEAVNESNFNVSETAIRGSVFPAYERAIAEGPQVIQEFLAGDASDGEKLALQYLAGSIGVGNDALIRSSSPRMANFLLIAADLEERFGVERANEIMPSVLRGLGGGFAQISDPLFYGPSVEVSGAEPSGFAGRTFQFFGDIFGTSQSRQTRETDPTAPGRSLDISQAPDDVVRSSAEQVMSSGDMTQEQVIGMIGAERFARLFPERVSAPRGVHEPQPTDVPPGGIDPSTVRAPLRRDVQQLNALIRRRDRVQSELARANLDRAIENMKKKIQESQRRPGG